MRKIWLSIAAAGLIASPLVGCDVSEDPFDGEDTTIGTDTGDDTFIEDTTPVAPDYFAILLTDRWDERCATSSVGAHGADIDAIGLFDPAADTQLVGYAAFARAKTAPPADGECNEYGYGDTDELKGAPDGALTSGFYSLYGGWALVEFDAAAQILDGYTVTVYEIGDDFCGGISSCVGDEGYDVYVATDLDCVGEGADGTDDTSACQLVQLTGDDGAAGEATIPVSLSAF